jgi:hypothetical protein
MNRKLDLNQETLNNLTSSQDIKQNERFVPTLQPCEGNTFISCTFC